MFLSARLKLTAWYVLTIMVVSAAFSGVIYAILTSEIKRFELTVPTDTVLIDLWRQRIKEVLWSINLALLAISTCVSYVLAGKALRPIQETMDEQNRFVSDASHELRTPLAALKSEIEVTLRDRHLSLDGAKKVLESNLEEVDNLSRLSNNLLEMSRYKNRPGKVMLEKIGLAEVLAEAIRRVRTQAEKRNIKIVSKPIETSVLGDKQGLVRLFTILLDNAVKYSGEGREVTVECRYNRKRATVDVSDQGEGIPHEDMPHIFDRFYRADKSRSKLKTAGYGLGLSIAKEIITAHGGELKVKSRPGKGSKFSVVLQIA